MFGRWLLKRDFMGCITKIFTTCHKHLRNRLFSSFIGFVRAIVQVTTIHCSVMISEMLKNLPNLMFSLLWKSFCRKIEFVWHPWGLSEVLRWFLRWETAGSWARDLRGEQAVDLREVNFFLKEGAEMVTQTIIWSAVKRRQIEQKFRKVTGHYRCLRSYSTSWLQRSQSWLLRINQILQTQLKHRVT